MERYETEAGSVFEMTDESLVEGGRLADHYMRTRQVLVEGSGADLRPGGMEAVQWLLCWPEMRALVRALEGTRDPWLRELNQQIIATIESRKLIGGMPE